MTTSELKNQVKNRLETVENMSLLEEILYLIDFESDNNEIFIIPDDHRKELEIGLEQKKDGLVVPNEIVKQKVQKWLSN